MYLISKQFNGTQCKWIQLGSKRKACYFSWIQPKASTNSHAYSRV